PDPPTPRRTTGPTRTPRSVGWQQGNRTAPLSFHSCATKTRFAGQRPPGSCGQAITMDYRGGRDASSMAGAGKTGYLVKGKKRQSRPQGPDWASGLKQLYASVIEEPILDCFKYIIANIVVMYKCVIV